MIIDAAAQMDRFFPKPYEEIEKPIGMPGEPPQGGPVANLGGGAPALPAVPPADREDVPDNQREMFDSLRELGFKMKFKYVERHHGDDDKLGFKMKMKAKLHGKIDDFSFKMKQEVKASYTLGEDGEHRAGELQQKFEFELKVKVDQSVESGEDAERFGEMMQAFGAIFQGFLQGLGGFLNGMPAAGQPPVLDDPIVEDEQGVVEGAAQEQAVAEAAAVAELVEAAAVEKPLEVPGTEVAEAAETTVVPAPAEDPAVSPFEDLVSRLNDLFAALTTELMGILSEFKDRIAAIPPVNEPEENEPEQESEDFQIKISFKFEAQLQYERAALGEPEPVIDLEG